MRPSHALSRLAGAFALTGAFVTSSACTPGRADAQTASIENFRQNAMSHAAPAAHVQQLCDEIGPRPAGSEAERRAISWGVEKMKSLGLQNVHEEPLTVPHWVRGEEHAAVVLPFAQKLEITALGGSVETPEGGLEADVIEIATLEALDQVSEGDVRGKIVFFNTPMERTRDGEGYSKAVPVRGAAAVAAAKKGAVGTIIRSIATSNSRLPHTGYMHYDEAVAKIPAGALSVPDAMLLSRLVKAGKPVRVRMTLGGKRLDEVASANVVGDVVGQEHPEQIVLVGAHLDSWDLGTGAVDDGAGVAIALELGNLVAHAPDRPKRTVRVVLFANEEFGLSGGAAYAAAHKDEIANHVLALEADFGAGGAYEVSVLAGTSAAKTMSELSPLLSPLGVGAIVNSDKHGSDLWPLRAEGVPVSEVAQDVSTYFDYHHSADDTFDKIDPPTLAQAASVFATFAYGVSRSTDDLGRLKPRELPWKK